MKLSNSLNLLSKSIIHGKLTTLLSDIRPMFKKIYKKEEKDNLPIFLATLKRSYEVPSSATISDIKEHGEKVLDQFFLDAKAEIRKNLFPNRVASYSYIEETLVFEIERTKGVYTIELIIPLVRE